MKKKNELELTPFGLRLALAAGASAFALSAGTAWAQDDQDDDVELIEESEEEASSDDEIVVTGSRIKRSTFNSISPLQVITSEDALDVGLIDPSAILQQSEAAAGQQIDATFQGFVLDNGPGSQTLNLRGLGADRTLLLINGRRFAPTGVEGAPSNPSINLLPGSLIDRYDLLLDGASSIYGSDAVAGVGNVILKKDFDGLEVFASGDYNQAGAGHDYTVSAAWGKNTDRAFFGIGAEYDYRDEIKLSDRSYLAGCDTHYEITTEGDIRTLGIRDAETLERLTDGAVSTSRSPCKTFVGSGAIVSPFQTYGALFFTGGAGNSGIPGFSENTINGLPVDADGDGLRDVDFQDFNRERDLSASFISEQKRFSVMSYGEYVFEGEANITPFFEALYVNAQIAADTGASQIATYVPGSNPFNPCNFVSNPNGVDCAAAEVTLLGRPGVNAGFPLPVRPFVSANGDRENYDVTLEQTRVVGGVRGDIPVLNVGTLSDWSFEVSGTYSNGRGESERFGTRSDRLAVALGIDPTVDADGDGVADLFNSNEPFPTLLDAPCDLTNVANPDLLRADLREGCVPVNLFNPDLIGEIVGDLQPEEAAYLFGTRAFDTVYEQTVISGYLTGSVVDLPAGSLSAVVGLEYRKDEIDSQPNDIAGEGLFFGFSRDLGAKGSKDIKEAFIEVDVPLLGGKPLARELSANVSARWTEEELYGTAWTYAAKAGWRPIDSLLFKASFGTSFRAPNLRENFLAGQTGFLNSFADPCAVPDDAIDAGGYNPSLDARDPNVLDICRREGRDPTRVGFDPTLNNTDTVSSVTITSGGSLDLDPETSESFTTGFAYEQPFFDSFDLNLAVNYYDIEISDSVVEPSGAFIRNDCYFRTDGLRSPFCDRITYSDLDSQDRGLIDGISAGFINLNRETVTGLDYNATFRKDFDAFDQPMTFRVNLRANQLKERVTVLVDATGNETLDEDAGEFGFPEWTGNGTASLDVDDFRFTWQTRYIGDVEQQADGIDPFDDVFGSNGTGFLSDTCLGPQNGDVYCRDVGFADEYYVHSASIRWARDTMVLRAGVTNVFDTNPPLVDSNEVFAISNTPIGNGYDLNGREFFLSVTKDF